MASVIGKLGAELLGPAGRGSRFACRHACRRDLGVYAAFERSVKPAGAYAGRAWAILPDVQQLFVLFHAPGTTWDHGLGFLQQPGIEQHIAFMRSLTERGLMVLGGPFADEDAAEAVGMAVIMARDATEAEGIALEDRSVASGLIRVTARPWTVPMGFALKVFPASDEG